MRMLVDTLLSFMFLALFIWAWINHWDTNDLVFYGIMALMTDTTFHRHYREWKEENVPS